VINPFDPFGWLGRYERRPEEPAERRLSPGWWMDEWLKATATWTNAASWNSATGLAPAPERVLLDIVEGVARRFAGQQLSIGHAQRPISIVLEWLNLRRRPPRPSASGDEGQVEMRIGGRDLDVHGWKFDEVEAVTQDVKLSLGRPSTLRAEGIDIVLRSPLERLLPRLQERLALEWSLRPSETGLIEARPRSRPNLVLVIQPVFVNEHIRLEIVAAHWKDLKVRVPGWLRLARSWRVPDLPGAGKVREASLRGGMLTARVRYEQVSQVIDLEQLRGAVQRGETILGLRS
jgi:hypothetical protein